MLLLISLAVLVAVAFVLGVVGFNRLARAKQAVAEAWAQVDTQLQRRFDLVGALNEVVAAAGAHERLALAVVTAGRDLQARDDAERSIEATARQLVATAEAYPALHTNTNFGQLHEQLVRTEDDIAASRRYYNGRVRDLNTTRETFPWMLLAGVAAASPAQYFQIDLDEGQAPRVG